MREEEEEELAVSYCGTMVGSCVFCSDGCSPTEKVGREGMREHRQTDRREVVLLRISCYKLSVLGAAAYEPYSAIYPHNEVRSAFFRWCHVATLPPYSY